MKDGPSDGLQVVESIYGTFYYHLAVEPAEGAPLKASCGKKTYMMRTEVPISAWGLTTHLGERYCPDCELLLRKLKR